METIYGIDGEELLDRIENKTAYVVRDNVKQNYYLLFSNVPTVALNSAIHDAFDFQWTIPEAENKDSNCYKSAFEVDTICEIDSAEKEAYENFDLGINMANLKADFAKGNLYRQIMNSRIYHYNNETVVDSIDFAGLCFINFNESEQKYTIRKIDMPLVHLKDMLEDASDLYNRAYRLACARVAIKTAKQDILSYLTKDERQTLKIELTESKKERK